jgi:aryl-alcohol dehydrogenase-like predicted oxidoreductase
VHGISSDNKLLPTPWQEQFAIALNGAFPALSRTREEGIIKGWGIGVNTPEPILRVMQESDPDVCLLASQYSLNEAQRGDAARQSPMRMARIGEARPILKETRYYPLAPVGAVAVTLRN